MCAAEFDRPAVAKLLVNEAFARQQPSRCERIAQLPRDKVHVRNVATKPLNRGDQPHSLRFARGDHVTEHIEFVTARSDAQAIPASCSGWPGKRRAPTSGRHVFGSHSVRLDGLDPKRFPHLERNNQIVVDALIAKLRLFERLMK